jgi:uncharacterized membrane protein
VTSRKYLVLAGIALFGAVGDSLLAYGMKMSGSLSLHHLSSILFAVFNPWVALGIVSLLFFFVSYMTALSWADLTFVLPATSLGYVLLTVIAKFLLHEQVTLTRWLGVLFISAGVGFVTRGPALTRRVPENKAEPYTEEAISSQGGR